MAEPVQTTTTNASTPSMSAIVQAVKRWPGPIRARSVTLAGFAARVLWFDAQVIQALDTGITQVAVIGAGYDSRACSTGGGHRSAGR